MELAKERRLNDMDWRGHIDRRLSEQDTALKGIRTTLDGHIRTTAELKAKVEPVVEAMDTMQSGIKVIGWIGNKIGSIGIFAAAIIGAITAWKGFK